MRRLLVSIWILFGVGSTVGSAEKLRINLDRDERFLPYRVDNIVTEPWGSDRTAIPVSARVLQAVDATHDTGVYITAYNPVNGDRSSSQVTLWRYPGRLIIGDNPVWMTITDFFPFTNPVDSIRSVVVLGYRNDSAFAVPIWPQVRPLKYVLIGTGRDSTGDGVWTAECYWINTRTAQGEAVESYIYVGESRDAGERRIVCFDHATESVKWSLPLAGTAPPHLARVCYDLDTPYLVLLSGSPAQGKSDTLFSDNWGYFISIDTTGRVAFAARCRTFSTPIYMAQADSTSVYCSFDLPFQSPHAKPDTSNLCPRIAKIGPQGEIYHEVRLSDQVAGLWTADYNGKPAVYTASFSHVYTVYDTALNFLAQSDTTKRAISLLNFGGKLRNERLILGIDDQGPKLFSSQLEKVAAINSPLTGYCEPLSYDKDSNVTAVLGSSPRHVFRATLVKSSVWDFLALLYVEHRQIILAVLFSLLVALMLVNSFRYRHKRSLEIIARQKEEIEETHRALKEAQAELVATAKYRQAQDIAGGFAHEIRNALFPAEAALAKLGDAVHPIAGQEDKVSRYLSGASHAVARAINSTRLISEYTKLDTQYLPEMVLAAEVVEEVLKANQLRFTDQSVVPQIEGDHSAIVIANKEQLATAMNNLVSNALDAIRGDSTGLLGITWRTSGDTIAIDVCDSGPGVPADQIMRIFDTFYSTKPSSGTGLGLPIARKIVELYAGTLTYRRQSDLTIFTITLPADSRGHIEDTKT